jgi:hypothetical protein
MSCFGLRRLYIPFIEPPILSGAVVLVFVARLQR